MDVKRFKRLPVMGILRAKAAFDIEPLMEAVASAGLETLEITMNSRNPEQLIRKAVAASGRRLSIGAGTVLDLDTLQSALQAGAGFIVMPVLIEDVLEYCLKNKIPAFPGAFSPQEIYRAWRAGATMVKVFPANFFGPEYFQEIKGPFGRIELLACGGVTPRNLAGYFAAGASAVSFGSGVFRQEWLENRDFKMISARIKKYLQAYHGLKA
ncbi:MAG: bifunctional 4-hydroxy-2-oxoglutarate aldolase/2-dehydro-3-deoxy-phosphogluconate aldolase [Candidatus Omnitrophota bacterium]|nr:bifunctional 4-hydroxy-2-oxoglutarate aldolase/2-dehydro-3-deoxy-phosphogluconate aldolase [Candidatus Omnitrophota bacterium]